MRRLRTSGLQFLLALLLSLALWTFVSFSTNPTVTKRVAVPVAVSNPSDGLMIVDPATGEPQQPTVTATVQVTGPQSDLTNISTASFTATADLSTLNAGLHPVPITVRGPRTVRIRATNPAQINIRLAPRASRSFPVGSDVRSKPPFLFADKPPVIGAQQAIVAGPQDLVTQVARVVVPLELGGRTANYTDNLPLVAEDQTGKPITGVTIDPATTSVSVVIAPRVDIQRVAVEPRFTGQQAPGYVVGDVNWDPKYVDVIAPIQITGTLRTEPIDLTNRTESFTQTVKLLDTGDQDITRLFTDTITVSVPIVPFRLPSTVELFLAVAPLNKAPDLQASVDPLGLSITVSGTARDLQQLNSTPPRATVDVGGRGPGTYTLPVTIELPPGLRLIGPIPQVSVTLTPNPPPASPGGGG